MPLESTLLAGFALVICLICIYTVFVWARRIQGQEFGRDSLVEALAEKQKETRLMQLDYKRYYNDLSSDNPFPNDITNYRREDLWSDPDRPLVWPDPGPFKPNPNLSDEENEAEEIYYNEWRDVDMANFEKFKAWAIAEKRIYDAQATDIEKRARAYADDRVPRSMDISLLGGGFSFILEFSTVIVLIFALVTLGIIGILEGREIATILAAIAGYVLGKASATGTKPTETKPVEPAPDKQQAH
jgi:hypothetical protein